MVIKLQVGDHQTVNPQQVHDGTPTRTKWEKVMRCSYLAAKVLLVDILHRHDNRDYSAVRQAYNGLGGEGWSDHLTIVLEVNKKIVAIWRDGQNWFIIRRHQ